MRALVLRSPKRWRFYSKLGGLVVDMGYVLTSSASIPNLRGFRSFS